MDAATLFMIFAFPAGGVDTATLEYTSLAECESEAARYKALGSPAPDITSDAYCVKHIPCECSRPACGGARPSMPMPTLRRRW